ncbi:hypothetical protein TRIP_B210002 [uncultured Desulfatiglans sp.]|uniref:Uncharacterized protein n=1 Tax=Uncultured Desulfatiglans sp. TaxID=1748965 RepID=A0A653A3R5_UNCDX|nr:hypothetical protein TRIP_B210002 [uncultured Desulfatiglans sp.]
MPRLCVNLRGCLCGDLQVASAQPLDFLDTRQKSSFSCRKRVEAENGLFLHTLRVLGPTALGRIPFSSHASRAQSHRFTTGPRLPCLCVSRLNIW